MDELDLSQKTISRYCPFRKDLANFGVEKKDYDIWVNPTEG
jgi:hypothetical protein